VLVNPVDIADGVLVNTIWSIGQMVARPRAGRRAAANMDIAGWADTEALVREALPDLQLELPGLTEVHAEELATALKRDEVQGHCPLLLGLLYPSVLFLAPCYGWVTIVAGVLMVP
jgi:hypothetical protein